jgi:hypothetical protein
MPTASKQSHRRTDYRRSSDHGEPARLGPRRTGAVQTSTFSRRTGSARSVFPTDRQTLVWLIPVDRRSSVARRTDAWSSARSPLHRRGSFRRTCKVRPAWRLVQLGIGVQSTVYRSDSTSYIARRTGACSIAVQLSAGAQALLPTQL